MTQVQSNTRTNLLNLGRQELADFVENMGEPRYRADQIGSWLHQKCVGHIDEMTNLSKAFREKLSLIAEVRSPEVITAKIARDGTRKWLMKLSEGSAIETVYIPERNRGTLCISSQVGCALNCSFCATGKEGFNRNLSHAEIIGQLWLAKRLLKEALETDDRVITNIVFMGMGEPLLNYDPVVKAIEWMLDDKAYGLSKYRVTVSTAGVVPAMLKLKDASPASLAISLHAPTDELRDELVPLNRKYPLSVLMPVCRDYFPKSSKRSVLIEYVLLSQVNDRLLHAKTLIKLLSGIRCKINLIPFNPFPGSRYETPDEESINRFHQCLVDAGFETRVRRTRGDDIDAACGQLAGEFKDKTGRHARWMRTGRLVPESRQ